MGNFRGNAGSYQKPEGMANKQVLAFRPGRRRGKCRGVRWIQSPCSAGLPWRPELLCRGEASPGGGWGIKMGCPPHARCPTQTTALACVARSLVDRRQFLAEVHNRSRKRLGGGSQSDHGWGSRVTGLRHCPTPSPTPSHPIATPPPTVIMEPANDWTDNYQLN